MFEDLSRAAYSFDACLKGYAVTLCLNAPIGCTVSVHERRRFRDEGASNVAARAHALSALGNGKFATVRSSLRGEVARGRCNDTNFEEVRCDLLSFHRWRLMWAAPLNFPEVVLVCEARGLFALIRHLARSANHKGLEILTLTDSMCVAMETGT